MENDGFMIGIVFCKSLMAVGSAGHRYGGTRGASFARSEQILTTCLTRVFFKRVEYGGQLMVNIDTINSA